MKTLGNLQTGVRTYLDESTQGDFLDSEVTSAINYAYHKVFMAVAKVYDGFKETTTPFTYALIKGTQEYLIDSSLIKVTRVEVNYSPQVAGSIPNRSIRISMDDALINIGNTAASGAFVNGGYYIHGDQTAQYIGLIPIPNQSDTTGKSLYVWGIQLPPDLSNSTDTIALPYPDEAGDIIEIRATARLLSKGQQEHKAAFDYINLFKSELKDYIDFIKERQSDGPDMIRDVEIDNLDFQTLPM
jgi:hypothetical protein